MKINNNKLSVLIATDVAARGIDIKKLGCVVNYDLPNQPENYVHRIGRTGRANTDGHSISFVNLNDGNYLNEIEKFIKKPIPRASPEEMEKFEELLTESEIRDSNIIQDKIK